MVDKPDGAVIVDKGATQGFEFDMEGRVSRYYYTILSSIYQEVVEVPAVKRKGRMVRPATSYTVNRYKNDTIFTNVFYDAHGQIICKRIRSGDYYDAFYYEYNANGWIKKEMHCKETNVSENKNEFKLGVQTVLSQETFEYENLTDTQIRKKCLNDEGREYKKAIINYDEKGNKLSENYEFIVGWMHRESVYEYNSSNKLIRRIYSGNESGDYREESTFEYTTKGFLNVEKKIKNKEVINEISYLFDDSTGLVKSHINRDFKNASIGIVKYGYTFY